MRKYFLLALCTASFFVPALAQDSSVVVMNPVAPPKKSIPLPDRGGDHLILQIGHNGWSGSVPDSISKGFKGFNRSANIYAMINKPFRSNPKLSLAFGLGIGTGNVYFKEMEVDVNATVNKLPFRVTQGANHFKKYKLTTTYLEVPLEFRFTAHPETPMKSVKFAIGGRFGTLLKAGTKGKSLLSSNGTSISDYTQKISSKAYFNTTRITGTLRAGYGPFGIYGAYTFTSLFKDGVAPTINTYQIGLSLSGL